MSKHRIKMAALPVLCGLSAIAAFALAPTVSMAETVTPASMGDWSFVDRGPPTYAAGTNPAGTGEIVPGPATPPLGTGSAHLETSNVPTTVVGEELRNTGLASTLLSDLTALSYWTYQVSNNGNLPTNQFVYLTIGISTTGGSVANDYIAFEPAYQSPPTHNSSIPDQSAPVFNSWQEWDALAGGWWSANGLAGCNPGANVCPLSDYLTAFPAATIANEASGLGAIRFAVGYTSGATDVLDGYVDAFTIGTAAGTTTFDFEPGSAVPLPAALPLFGSGLGVVGGILGWRKRRKRLAQAAA
jgi:hypothetical protein